ncbi:hypothetical protein E2P81_ATG00060 [Venturia nashicola]|nr:hypothetical protein E2P81_ATG00060 [Venturia nashicola]
MRASTIIFGLFASFAAAAPLSSSTAGPTGILGSAVGSNLGSVVGTGSGNKASSDGNSATGNGNGNSAGNGNGNGNSASADGNTLGSDIGNFNVGLPSTINIDPTIDVPITLRTR